MSETLLYINTKILLLFFEKLKNPQLKALTFIVGDKRTLLTVSNISESLLQRI